ncbi:hypothetical protein ACFXG4_01045 [Nocardia sp. NPDC059246]|uniref:hypothetical protein n=1 Tax=Nocardia sp. NPDC059246 TaxID=3346789 RepID=UPI0036A1B9E7
MVKRLLLLLSAVAGVILLATGTAAAGPVTVHDDSKVLDVTKVTNAALQLTDPVQIFTTEKYSDDRAKFDTETQTHVKNPTDVVLAINTKTKWLTIRTGANSHIRDTTPAGTAFGNALGSGDYTGATIAALGALKTAADQAAPTSVKAGNPAPAHQPVAKPESKSSGWGWLGLLCPILVIGGIIAAVVAFVRRRRGTPPPPPAPFGGGGFGGGYAPGGPGYGAPPPPPYGGGRPGMSPGAAAGLGAVGGALGGGLLGYELGRMEGEHERDRGPEYGPPPESGGYGGYDPGPQEWGGSGGDYDFGGGSDFGGGDSGGGGDFGGGGDSGGGDF